MIDVIGTIYTAGEYDEDGNVMTEPEPKEGYHVNVAMDLPDFNGYRLDPATPYRVFGDAAHTIFLKFVDRDEWLSLGLEYTDEEGSQAFDTQRLLEEGTKPCVT